MSGRMSPPMITVFSSARFGMRIIFLLLAVVRCRGLMMHAPLHRLTTAAAAARTHQRLDFSRSFTAMSASAAAKNPPLPALVTEHPTISDHHLEQLASDRFVVIDNFLSAEEVSEIHADLQRRYAEGDMQEAGIKGVATANAEVLNVRQVVSNVRLTQTVWLNTGQQSLAEGELLCVLDKLRARLGEYNRLSLHADDTEVLYAHYPQGGFYKRHVDSHARGTNVRTMDTERAFSFILYVNQRQWTPECAGQLRMHRDVDGTSAFTDIPPIPGTLVLFYSQGQEHEVLPTSVERRAVVGWFRVRNHRPSGLYI